MKKYNNTELIKLKAAFYLSCISDGFSSSKEESEFNEWIKKSEHKKIFESLKSIQNSYSNISLDTKSKISAQVHSELKRESVFRKLKVYSIAAAMVFIIAIGAFQVDDYMNFIQKQNYSTQMASKNITLPDGSNLILDAKTLISTKFFEDKRVVSLESGRVFFDVKRNIKRPFIINTKAIQIKVLGTSFEVKENKNNLEVNVISGLVSISKINNNSVTEITKLSKGKQILFDKIANNFHIDKVDIQSIASWKDGMLHFKNNTLKEVVQEFKKYKNLDVVIQKDIEELSISGLFSIDNFDNFLYAIGEIYSLKSTKKGKRIFIFKKI